MSYVFDPRIFNFIILGPVRLQHRSMARSRKLRGCLLLGFSVRNHGDCHVRIQALMTTPAQYRRQGLATRAFMMADSRKAEDFYFEVYLKHGGAPFMRPVFDTKKNWL